MKAKAIKATLLILLPSLSFSCSDAFAPKGPYQYGKLDTAPFAKVEEKGYYRVGDYASLHSNSKEIKTDFTSIFQTGNFVFNMPSTGEVPLLVVPIDFTEKVGGKDDIAAIENAFCGGAGLNQYFSVAEYFALSSKDRLHLKPYVLPSFFRSPTYSTISSLSSIRSSSTQTSVLMNIYKEAKEWLPKAYPELDLSKYSFQSKNEKDILPIYFIYNAPYAGEYEESADSRNSMLWAFTINNPAPISWSSIDMLHNNGGKVDAHTYIHECGHLFGLSDYYDTSSTQTISRTSHLGRMDMMDCSLGDENCFSKMLLDWERPFVPTESTTITLHQSAGNNECILLSPNWNGTPYDSYLLLEFYTPTHLNYVDSHLRSDETMRLFQKAGVKIYLVDAELGIYNGRGVCEKPLTEDNYNGERLFMRRNNSNFPSPLIRLLNKKQNSAAPTAYYIASDHEEDIPYYIGGKVGTAHLSESLFFEGDGIDKDHFYDIRINGQELGWDVKIAKVTSSYAKVTLTLNK